MIPFGTQLLNARKARGWTQTTLAAQIDVLPQTVSGWETGQHQPSRPTLVKLCEALRMAPEDAIRLYLTLGYPYDPNASSEQPQTQETAYLLEQIDGLESRIARLESALVSMGRAAGRLGT